MLKYPCLVLDHDDTVVQSEATVNYPYFVYILDQFRPGTTITLDEYVTGCSQLGFAPMCRAWYGFTEEELEKEYRGWKEYIRGHIPAPYPGIDRILRRQKEEGGILCVVSMSSEENIRRDYRAHFGLEPDAIFGWDLPAEHRKPSPYALEQIMVRYSLSPDKMLALDDMKPGAEMAKKVGVPVAYAGWCRQGHPELAREMKMLCDFSFDSPNDLERFLFEEDL